MKPYFNDDFSKLLIERALAGMTGQISYGMTNEEKCNHTPQGVSCPSHGDNECSSEDTKKEEFAAEAKNKEGKEQGADGKACWKGYKYAGTEGGKDKCVKAGYEMEGEEELDEKAPPGAKYERMVKHIKKGYEEGGVSKKEKSIAYATAWKQKNKEMKKEEWEGGKEDKEEDKKLAKKHKMSMKDWEKSAADKKHDMKKEEMEKGEKEEKGEKKHKEGKAEEKKEMKKEAKDYLPGSQEKLDANKNGKLDADDFKKLRARKGKKTVKEMIELALEGKKPEIEIMPEIDDSDPANLKDGKKKKENAKEKVKEEIETLKRYYRDYKNKYSG